MASAVFCVLPSPSLHPKPSSFLTANTATLFSSSLRFTAKMSRGSVISSLSSNAAVSGVVSVGEELPADYEEWLPKRDPKDRRRAGVLLHPTSFRGPYGIGDLGEEALRFIDWLHDAGCSVWQVNFLKRFVSVELCCIVKD